MVEINYNDIDIAGIDEADPDKDDNASEEEESASFNDDDLCKATPLPHQKDGIEWMLSRFLGHGEDAAPGIIIGDDMGLGKTLQSIMMLKELFTKLDKNIGPRAKADDEDITAYKRRCAQPKPKVLVVVPLTVLHHWEKEFWRVFPKEHTFVYHGTDKEKSQWTPETRFFITSYGQVMSQCQAIPDALLEKYRLQLRRKDLTKTNGSEADYARWLRGKVTSEPRFMSYQEDARRAQYRLHISGIAAATNMELRNMRKRLPFFFQHTWDCIILDEAHTIRNGVTYKVTSKGGHAGQSMMDINVNQNMQSNMSYRQLDATDAVTLAVDNEYAWPSEPVDVKTIAKRERDRLIKEKVPTTQLHFLSRVAYLAQVPMDYVKDANIRFPRKSEFFRESTDREKRYMEATKKKKGKSQSKTRFGVGAFKATFEACCLLDADYRLAMSGTIQQNHISDVTAACVFLRTAPYNSVDWWKAALAQEPSVGKNTRIQRCMKHIFLRRLKTILDLPPCTKTTRLLDLHPSEYSRLRAVAQEAEVKFKEARKLGRQRKSAATTEEKRKLNSQILVLITAMRMLCNSVKTIAPNAKEDEESIKLKATIEQLRVWMAEPEQYKKIVIFSQFVKFLDLIETHIASDLPEYDGAVLRYQGNIPVKKRVAAKKRFKDDESARIFLISTTSGNTGLTLITANCLLMTDISWNPYVDDQAFDRIYRYGQKEHVHITRFISRSSVEEWIDSIQQKKRQDVEALIKDGSAFGVGSASTKNVSITSPDELRKLFRQFVKQDDAADPMEEIERSERRSTRRAEKRKRLPQPERDGYALRRSKRRGRPSRFEKTNGEVHDKWEHPFSRGMASTNSENESDFSAPQVRVLSPRSEMIKLSQSKRRDAQGRLDALKESIENQKRNIRLSQIKMAREAKERAKQEREGGTKTIPIEVLNGVPVNLQVRDSDNQVMMDSYMEGAVNEARDDPTPRGPTKPVKTAADILRENEERQRQVDMQRKATEQRRKAVSDMMAYKRLVLSKTGWKATDVMKQQLIIPIAEMVGEPKLPPAALAGLLNSLITFSKRKLPKTRIPTIMDYKRIFEMAMLKTAKQRAIDLKKRQEEKEQSKTAKAIEGLF